jgi:hypothetical protein
LNKPFEVVIEAELDEKGKLKNPRFTKKAGDENLVEPFGKLVAALNDVVSINSLYFRLARWSR